jgi:glutaredoxin
MEAMVFSTPKCTWCNKVINILEDSNIEVTKVDVAESVENFEKMQNYAGEDIRSVPQVVIDNEFVGGYTEVERFLNRLK